MSNSTSAERNFLMPWLCAATVVTLIRILHAADLSLDLSYQTQVAQNLVAGIGFVGYEDAGANLADPIKSVTLTAFPAGFSLYAAALTVLGAGPGTVMKLLAAISTMFGWWGWARLAFAYMGEGWRKNRSWRWIGCFIAVGCPLSSRCRGAAPTSFFGRLCRGCCSW
jgi:hypothetical protein